MARALFKAWFVDFEPVRAKMEGRWQRGQSLPGLPAHLYDLFPEQLVESELGEIPEGWRVGSVYDIADVRYGAPFASSKFNSNGNGLPLVRIRDLRDERPGVWTPEIHPKGYLIQPGDIIVGMDGEFRAYLWGGDPAWMNQRICAFHSKRPYCPVFVRNAIEPHLARVEATEIATTVIHLGKGDIDEFRVVIPEDKVAREFERLGQPLFDKIVLSKQQSAILAEQRDTLLPKLVSGAMRVPEAERIVGAAI
jgi:type I restriction enzyme, S subunit